MSQLLDPYPLDQTRIIKDLERRVEQLEALLRRTTGTPVTQASSEFFIPDSPSTPDVPTGGIVLYSSSGAAWWRSGTGTTRPLTPPQIPATSNPAAFIVGSAPSSYNSGWGGDMRAALLDLHTTVTTLMTRMRATSPPILAT
ncbi:hypothetical protein [Streptosporangium sp. NPDC049376]|uniref:hypothetical protein n=1 Tax=Streptosporangium sp. NPDC049376 TaxID=3366192 RepID=UPI0037A07A09